MSHHLWILLVGALCGGSCALVGAFLVLRKLSMLGDAISHAVLPGIVIAFMISGSRSSIPMLLGAGALGLLTVFLVESLYRTRRVAEDASIGIVFPALFAIGVILVSSGGAASVDLDPDCVLYGEIEYTPLDQWVVFDEPPPEGHGHVHGPTADVFGPSSSREAGISLGPRAVWILGGLFLLNLGIILLFYKELKLCTFDPDLAAALGFRPTAMHYLLMGLVSLTTVGSFESVGAILVVAMLIAPAAGAYLLTDHLGLMIGLSVLLGVLSSSLGYGLSVLVDGSVAGSMATMAGVLFALAFCFSPNHGLLFRWVRRRRLARAFEREAFLMQLARVLNREPETFPSVKDMTERLRWRAGHLQDVVADLEEDGMVATRQNGRLELTDRGREVADELLTERFGD